LRIAFLHPHFTIRGGGSHVILELASRLSRRGHDVAVISLRQDPALLGGYHNVKFYQIPGRLPSQVLHYGQEPIIFSRLVKAIKDFCPDVLVSNVAPSEYWGAMYKLAHLQTKAVWYCHDSTILGSGSHIFEDLSPPLRLLLRSTTGNPLFRKLTRSVVRRMDGFVANSVYTADILKRLYGLAATVVYPGVDPDIYKPFQATDPYLLCVGQLTKYKNFDLAIDSIALCSDGLKDAGIRLRIVGDGPQRDELAARAKMAGVADLVEFAGPKEYNEMPEIYGKARLTLQPSIHEGFGLVPIESMACGTPVIAGQGGGAMETIVDGVTGFLVPPTKQEFASAIEKSLRNSDLIEKMRLAARAHVLQYFTWDRSVVDFERVLDGFRPE